MSPPPASESASSSVSSERTLQNYNDASESTPLLAGKPSPGLGVDASSPLLEDGGVAQPKAPAGKPLPRTQVSLLCFVRILEPIAFFAIFPFIAQMVQRNGNLPDSDVGFYSGLIESLFSLTQVVVLIFWGRLADRVGRKPVLLWSLFGMTVATVLFTMATSIWEMILFRCLAGVLSGSTLVIRTMLSDHTTTETQAVAFSWFAFAGNIGIFFGPILGGVLADPVAQYPSVFKGIAFFERYPYSLAGFAIAAVSAVLILVSVFFLDETLKPDDSGSPSSSGATAPQLSIRELLKAPGVVNVIWTYTHVMFLAFAFTAILPVVLWTPVDLGGEGFSPFQISIYMALLGGSQALWLVLVFPGLHRRWGTKGVLKACATAYPMLFAGYIVMNAFLRVGTPSAVAWFWVLCFIVSIIGPGVSMAFTGVQLAVNDVSPNPHLLGTLNAMAMTASSAIRSFVPGVATAIFAIGARNQIFWGHLAWIVLIPIACALYITLKWLPEDKKSSRNDE